MEMLFHLENSWSLLFSAWSRWSCKSVSFLVSITTPAHANKVTIINRNEILIGGF